MASIEILENTLLKLLVRRGTDQDRQQITLDEGELGYATDTTRLFIGDGTTVGGNLIGNKFLGSNPDITIFTGEVNDLAFDSDNNLLYRIKENNGSSLSDWEDISNLVSAGNDTINVDSVQRITVGTLSAGNFDADALGSGITLDTSNRIALSSTISIDEITQRTIDDTSYLTIPSKLKISSISYDFPATGATTNNSVLLSDTNNQLSWGMPSVITSTVPTTTANQIPAGTIVPFITAAEYVPYGWLECDGSQVAGADYPDLSAVIGTRYGGDSTNFNLPNFVNATLYGSDVDDPYLATKFSVASGSNISLSAFGTTYIIKAIEDRVVAPTINFSSPLSATLNGVNITDTATEFLSGTIVVGLSGFKEDNAIYKTIYLDEPVSLYAGGLNAATWSEQDLSGLVPSNTKVIHGSIHVPRTTFDYNDTIIYSSYTNALDPADTSAKFIIGGVQGQHDRRDGIYVQFSSRVDVVNSKLYLAASRDNANMVYTVDIYGYSI